jgi:hypothetical protein
MVPAGADLHKMIRRPSPIVETGDKEIGNWELGISNGIG